MRQSVRIWRVALSALLMLAVVFVWPPVGSDPESSMVHTATTASDSHHSHEKHRSSEQDRHGALNDGCQGSVTGCCMMTHCHPGISVKPHEMAAVTTHDEMTDPAAVQGLGSEPGVILPPPRRL